MTRLILAAAFALAVLAILRRRPEPVEDDEMATAFLDTTPIRIRLPEQATVTWRH